MRRNTASLSLVVWVLGAAAQPASAADWPMWRCDAARSAASVGELPAELRLQWVRKLPPPRMAWPNEPRLHFDASNEPVVMGKTLFLGSPNDGSVAAFDTASGEERWRFYTEGPVRFAPVAWRGRVFVGSDDGHLYCLDAAKGTVAWKARGAPDDRPDRRHLGNARLISFWPVRGGPVLADGVVYFAAGIWPTLGVFVVAIDAASGRVVWRNNALNYIEKVRIDHNRLHEAGLSPQGYLVVAGDTLLVPNGRSMPAGLDRTTGTLRYYVQGYRHGDCRVTAEGTVAFVGQTGVVDTRTGREVGSRWAAAGKDAPQRFDARKFHLFEGPITAYKFQPGLSWRSALTSGVAFGSRQGIFYAHDLSRAAVSEYDKTVHGHAIKPWRWDAPLLWKLASPHARSTAPSDVVIKAGNRVYGHAGKTLVAIDLPAAGGQPTVAWHKPLDGTPSSMLAADAKLFVVTSAGDIHCFGGTRVQPKVHPRAAGPLRDRNDEWAKTTAAILNHTKASEGYALVLGLGTGRLLEELLGQSKLKVIGVGRDKAKVDALRTKLVAAGLYGTRAEVFVGEPFGFPFPQYLASLIVSEDLAGAGFSMERPAGKLFDVLRPYGGVACLAVPTARVEGRGSGDEGADAGATEFSSLDPRPSTLDPLFVAGAKLERAEMARAGRFVLLRRVGPLPGSASWTHETADAARSYFSHDRRAKAPLGVLWYGDGPDHGFWKRKDYGIGVKPQVIGGRLFAFQVGGRMLRAYDVYTGRVLWTRKVDAFTRYVSRADGIYVAGGDTCQVLDPATGVPLRAFTYRLDDPERRPPIVADIRVTDDEIVIAAAFEKVRVIEKGLWDSTELVALDRATGRQLWARRAKDRFNSHAIAMGGGMVFCVDSLSGATAGKAARRGDTPASVPSTLMALDARTGSTKWTAVTAGKYRTYAMGHWCGMRAHDDWVAYSAPHGLVLAGKHGQARAYAARTGQQVWQAGVGAQPLILRGDTFVPQGGVVFDTRTGKRVGKKALFGHVGCNYAVGSTHLFLVRLASACYVDAESGKRFLLRNVRSGCSNSLIAADGLVSVPCFAVGCVCNYPIQTSFALVHMPEVAAWAGRTPLEAPKHPSATASRTGK